MSHALAAEQLLLLELHPLLLHPAMMHHLLLLLLLLELGGSDC
jgi:hypothetical protein